MLADKMTGSRVGMVGVGLLIASWVAVGLGSKIVSATVVPYLWTVVLFAGLPVSLLLGTMAGWKGSRWWFILSGLSLLSEAFCLLSVAV